MAGSRQSVLLLCRLLFDIARASIFALFLTQIMSCAVLDKPMVRADPVIDPEVRALARVGTARVLVMLQVGEISDEGRRVEAIGRAQDSVLARLPQSHAYLVRRYESVPLLALEIDATALRALETMTDVVAGVKLDRAVKPQ